MSPVRIAPLVLVAVVPVLGAAAPAVRPPEVQLAAAGRANLPIVVGRQASPRVRAAAKALAEYLRRISGATFAIREGDGPTGIALGRPDDFPGQRLPALADARDVRHREDYRLESHAGGVRLLGATDLAVEHAVWDLLYRLGHRQFFPGPTWEVLPRRPDLRLAVCTWQRPSFHSRRIWYGYGAGPWSAAAYADWCVKNRAVAGVALNTGHAYDGILARNRAAFARHPEYLGLVGGDRRSSKVCIGNPGLRRLVIDDALRQFADDPDRDSISIDPSDGGGWCECERCRALGSVSDRALTLANEVAAAVTARHPGKLVGMYAYSQHSPPPSLRVHPAVVISVATAFVTGGYSLEQLLAGWGRQGATLGLREYFSVNVWDRDLPGKPRAANLDYLRRTIPHFHASGARFFSAESSDNWGPCGPGYYLAARMLWDVGEADRLDERRADFLDRAFGAAREPMDRFYGLIDGANRPLLTDDLLGRMYRLLAEARRLAGDDHAVLARIADLVLYTRYVELWLDYSSASGAARQQAFEAMIRHTYRMRGTMMIHVLGLARDLPRRDRTIRLPEQAGPRVPAGKNPWMSDEPFRPAEITTLIERGIAARKTYTFSPRSFSDELVSAAPLKLADGKPGTMGGYSRGTRTVWTWVEKAPATLALTAQAGRIYTNRGDARVALYPQQEPEGKAVAEATVPPDRQEHPVRLATPFAGLHRVELSDGSAGTALRWPEGRAQTILSSPEQPAAFQGRWSLYFYVPRGTREVGGYASGEGRMLDGAGKTVHTFPGRPGYFHVPVPPGQDGRLWKMEHSTGQRLLMTVPPCLAPSAAELLLPAEVVRRDAGR